jgi:ABC-type proline/glycine betaine transport system ATPase subunit
MINQLIAIDSGSMRVAGEDVRDVRGEKLRRRIGYEAISAPMGQWSAADGIALHASGFPARLLSDRM